MTEKEWLESDKSSVMVKFLWLNSTERKLRLFAVACCRMNWESMSVASKLAVEQAELFADGATSLHELQAASRQRSGWRDIDMPAKAACSTYGHEMVSNLDLVCIFSDALFNCVKSLRCIFGNPFRPMTASSAWQTANVVGLAQTIYADRAFKRLPILADALEDAGCDHSDILNHCRQPGEHVRGCWVVDLLLGKK